MTDETIPPPGPARDRRVRWERPSFDAMVRRAEAEYRICPDCDGILRGDDDDLWCSCGYARRWDGQEGQWITGPSREGEA